MADGQSGGSRAADPPGFGPRRAPGRLFPSRAKEAAGGDRDAAIVLYEKALALDPNFAAAHNAYGTTACELGRYDQASAHLMRAITLAPNDPANYLSRGILHARLHRHHEALADFEQALTLRPRWREALNNKANVLRNLHRGEEAVAAYNDVLAMNPEHVPALYNRILVLRDLNQLAAALADSEQIIALRPHHPTGHNERGTILADMGRHEDAIASFKAAISLDANYADAHWNLGLAYLVTGQLVKGWPEYEWRWRKSGTRPVARTFTQAMWTGQESLIGKTILLHAEQGFGDTIQFCRYAPLVKARGGRVLLEAPAALLPLLDSLNGVDELIASGQSLPAFDCHCPLLSLPQAFRTDLDSIPATVPYLGVNAEKVAVWQTRLDPKRASRVGIVWSGSAAHANDRHRSLPLATLLQAMPDGIDVIGIQKEIRDQDTLALRTPVFRNYSEQIEDFADTAALMSLMDIVISVDTSVIHLAGALGKPAWLLLAAIHDWRWLTGRSDSPWYPSLRIFRQQSPGDWLPVVMAVKEALNSITS